MLAWTGERYADRGSGVRPHPPLTRELAERLLQAAAPGERIEAHCRAVAAEALRIAEALPLELDGELLACAALLHDVARKEKDHARLGAAWLRELGYEEAAALVEQHHDLAERRSWTRRRSCISRTSACGGPARRPGGALREKVKALHDAGGRAPMRRGRPRRCA